MGAQHFTLHMVLSGANPKRDANGDYAGDFLLPIAVSEGTVASLRALLPKPNHWGKVEEFNSAHDWGSDLRIYHAEDGRISDIVMRYAPAGDSIETLRTFVDIIRAAGCQVLVESSGEIIPADFDLVEAALSNHRAFRFLKDPLGTIIEAADETNEKG
jgi:hypothetical protein